MELLRYFESCKSYYLVDILYIQSEALKKNFLSF